MMRWGVSSKETILGHAMKQRDEGKRCNNTEGLIKCYGASYGQEARIARKLYTVEGPDFEERDAITRSI
jgi:hypothetical protein